MLAFLAVSIERKESEGERAKRRRHDRNQAIVRASTLPPAVWQWALECSDLGSHSVFLLCQPSDRFAQQPIPRSGLRPILQFLQQHLQSALARHQIPPDPTALQRDAQRHEQNAEDERSAENAP